MLKVVVLIIIGMMLGGMPHITHLHKSTTGVIIPLYSFPNNDWDSLVNQKMHHQSVPMIVIVNPNNGPGIQNQDYATGIQKLQHARIIVLGYVFTNYGLRNSTSVMSDIDSYKNWYHVNGIFFDEMSHSSGFETYYSNLTNYTKSLGMIMTVGNPGVDTIPSYIGTVDNLVIYEKDGLPAADLFGGWHTNYTKSNFSIILYGVNNLNSTYIKFLSDHAGYIYATDQSQPNPWEKLSSYIDEIISTLQIGDHDESSKIEKKN